MITAPHNQHESNTSRSGSRNACKLCAPLGACLAFMGVEGAMPFLHGSQGCSTYIRRYMISHFKEPVDIASSNFSEEDAVFGGRQGLSEGIRNVCTQYDPKLLGVATTCLAETIGDDVGMYLRELREEDGDALPPIVNVSTPSYTGTHAEGFRDTLREIVKQLVGKAVPADETDMQHRVNIISGMLSPADLRHLKELAADFDVEPVILPDYSDTLDGATWEEYHVLPQGGTPIDAIRGMGASLATLELAWPMDGEESAGAILRNEHNVPLHAVGLPIGVIATDAMLDAFSAITGKPVPEKHVEERGRLIDAMVDAHKYLYGKKAVVFGEEELVVGVATFLSELGVVPILCASGGKSGRLQSLLKGNDNMFEPKAKIIEGADFQDIEEAAAVLKPDFLIGSSKGHKMSKRIGAPLVRIGFPIHDRIGGSRVLHIGYRGAQRLFDQITNTLIEAKQNASPVGYTYM